MPYDLNIQGAIYEDVPYIDAQKSGGGYARFIDPSDTTATVGDVLADKGFYLADGTFSQGTLAIRTDPLLQVNMMGIPGNKGFRQINGSISGNGTDPNWLWWDLVPTDGCQKIKYYLQGYTTVASIMFFNANRQKLSEIHGSGAISGDIDIPSNAKYAAISCRTTESSSYKAQYCWMYGTVGTRGVMLANPFITITIVNNTNDSIFFGRDQYLNNKIYASSWGSTAVDANTSVTLDFMCSPTSSDPTEGNYSYILLDSNATATNEVNCSFDDSMGFISITDPLQPSSITLTYN